MAIGSWWQRSVVERPGGAGATAAKSRLMRNRELHDALRDFALESAKLLRDDQVHGAEVQFDLDEGSGSGAILYHYRPLTSEYIGERWHRLRLLPSM